MDAFGPDVKLQKKINKPVIAVNEHNEPFSSSSFALAGSHHFQGFNAATEPCAGDYCCQTCALKCCASCLS